MQLINNNLSVQLKIPRSPEPRDYYIRLNGKGDPDNWAHSAFLNVPPELQYNIVPGVQGSFTVEDCKFIPKSLVTFNEAVDYSSVYYWDYDGSPKTSDSSFSTTTLDFKENMLQHQEDSRLTSVELKACAADSQCMQGVTKFVNSKTYLSSGVNGHETIALGLSAVIFAASLIVFAFSSRKRAAYTPVEEASAHEMRNRAVGDSM